MSSDHPIVLTNILAARFEGHQVLYVATVGGSEDERVAIAARTIISHF